MIVLILLFNGTVLYEKFELPIAMDAYECMTFSEKYRDAIATHKWFEGDEKMKSGYYLNDGRGTLQGFIC
tara:strand:+ start:59 stop:268 length:210 start_codon:yes stop_codon:yes gene_type:complete